MTALLMIDIQNDYFAGGANPLNGSIEASLQARRIADAFRANGLPVVHIRHLAVRPDSTFFAPGTYGAEIHENVSAQEGEKIIIKHYPNSFRDTELLDYLRSLSVTDLVVCGMMTHMCVDATVRAAKDFGFGCTVIGDACTTKELTIQNRSASPQDVQTAFLASLNYFYSTVLTADEFLSQE